MATPRTSVRSSTCRSVPNVYLRVPNVYLTCTYRVAYGNAENQRALIDMPQFLPSMASIIRPKPGEQIVRQEQANAVHALSQVGTR
jgi:hypothetical protein